MSGSKVDRSRAEKTTADAFGSSRASRRESLIDPLGSDCRHSVRRLNQTEDHLRIDPQYLTTRFWASTRFTSRPLSIVG
jgi:hypothetical protein